VKRAAFLAILALSALLLTLLPARAQAAPIRLWHGYRGEEEKALAEILATWKGEPVETLSIPFDAYTSKLSAAVPMGEGPDLFIAEAHHLGDYRARKILAPVGDALEPAGFSPTALAAVTMEGAAWAVPLSQKCVALYVNTDLVKEVPADLEGIAELAGKLPSGVLYPLGFEPREVYSLAALLSAFDVRLLDAEDHYLFVGPEAARAVDLTLSLVDRHVIPADADTALISNLFRNGQVPFAISGPWFAADLGGKVHYRVAPLPLVRATGKPMRPLLTVESVMLSPGGAARAEVRKLARLLAGADAALVRARLGPTPSARVDVELPEGAARAFAAQARDAIPVPSSVAMDAVWEPANRAIRKALRRDASAAVALAEGKSRFDDVSRPLPGRASPLPLTLLVGALGLYLAVRWVRLAKQERWSDGLRASLPAYRYLAHAVIAVGLLVIVPLVMGAATAFTAGNDEARHFVGFANFVNILTARGGPLLASGSFYLVLLVTIAWAVINVAFHVAIGVALALLLSRPTLRFKAFYRVLLIVPWAVPSYITALTWKGMFDRQFGAVSGLILWLDHALGLQMEPIAWFSSFWTAFTANLATNIWLGFPFMMVVTLGALTGVSADVLEAARVDGATRWQRLWLVTLPIIRPTLMPSVTLGTIWTFNMFNVVFLVSGGDPDGTTDILVSEAYHWAFTRQNQYGYAAAYAVLIFILLSFATRLTEKKPVSTPTAKAATLQASTEAA
jgi:arabinogalactan oligomer/maltooligosaccharide transport system permease protein